jgi:predicted permease
VNIALGALMGRALVRLLGTPKEFRGAAVASASFGNSLALPVVLISAVIGAGPVVGDVVFDEDAQAESILYLGAYMTTLTVLMWTIGPVLMKEGTSSGDTDEGAYGKRSLADVSADLELSVVDDSSETVAFVEERVRRSDSAIDITLQEHTSHDVRGDWTCGRDVTAGSMRDASSVSGGRPKDTKNRFGSFISAAGPAMNANVFASLSGILVGIVPQLRATLFEKSGALFVVQECASMIAAGAIPQVIIILGASLASGPVHELCDRKTAAGVGAIRLVCLPAVNVCLFLVLRKCMPPSFFPRSPAFWLTFLVEGATPTANNMMLQVQMFGSRAAADGVAAALFWQYAAAPALLTGAVALFLAIL